MAVVNLNTVNSWLKTNVTFDLANNYLYKSSGATSAYDGGAISTKCLKSPSTDQSFRWLVKNIGKESVVGVTNTLNFAFANFLFAFQVLANNNLLVIESGVTKVTQTNVINENSELRIQIIETTGVLSVKYYRRDASNQAEQLVYTSVITDAVIRASFPLLFGVNFKDFVSATPTTSSAIETATLEADADKIVDLINTDSHKAVVNLPIPLTTVMGNIAGGAKQLPNHQLSFTGENLTTARNGILTFKANKDWEEITGIRLSVFEPNTTAPMLFNIRKNNTNLFNADELKILANQKQVDLVGLSFAVTDTDEFILDYKSVNTLARVPIILELTVK